MQKGKAWRRGLRELHTFKTLRFRGQSHIGVPPAACGVDEHCLSPQSPGENTIVERLCQWVKSLFPHAPNGCLSGGFPNNPFQSLPRRLLLAQWPHPKGTENPSIQKQLFARTVLVVARTVLVVARLVLDVSWFCPSPVSARKRVFGPKTSRKRKTTGRKRAEKPPSENPMFPPQKKSRSPAAQKQAFFWVPFLIMRKVLNQG